MCCRPKFHIISQSPMQRNTRNLDFVDSLAHTKAPHPQKSHPPLLSPPPLSPSFLLSFSSPFCCLLGADGLKPTLLFDSQKGRTFDSAGGKRWKAEHELRTRWKAAWIAVSQTPAQCGVCASVVWVSNPESVPSPTLHRAGHTLSACAACIGPWRV